MLVFLGYKPDRVKVDIGSKRGKRMSGPEGIF